MILGIANILTDGIGLEPVHVNQNPKRNNQDLQSPSTSSGVLQALGKILMTHDMMLLRHFY